MSLTPKKPTNPSEPILPNTIIWEGKSTKWTAQGIGAIVLCGVLTVVESNTAKLAILLIAMAAGVQVGVLEGLVDLIK